jgi:hypothetical protein
MSLRYRGDAAPATGLGHRENKKPDDAGFLLVEMRRLEILTPYLRSKIRRP